MRAAGIAAASSLAGSSEVMSVSMKPGVTALTVMLRLPISFATTRVNPRRPALEAA